MICFEDLAFIHPFFVCLFMSGASGWGCIEASDDVFNLNGFKWICISHFLHAISCHFTCCVSVSTSILLDKQLAWDYL